MADQKLADMTTGAAISASDLFYTEQSGVQKKVTGTMLAANTASYLSGLTSTTTLNGADKIYVNQTTDKAITVANFMLNASASRIRAIDYGAKFDALEISGCTTTGGAKTISTPNYSFTSTDVGKIFVIKSGPTSATYMNSAGSTYVGTITSVSSGVATAAVNIPSSTTTGIIYFGTDDTVAIQAAIDAGNPGDAALGGSGTWLYLTKSVVELPVGMALTTQELIPRPNVSVIGQGMFATTIKWASASSMATTNYYGIFNGGQANGSTRIYYNWQFRDMKLDATAAYTTTYSYHSKCIEMIYTVRPVVMNVWFEGSPGTALGMDYVSGGLFSSNRFENCGRLWTSGAGGGSGMDFQTAVDNYTPQNTLIGLDSRIVSNNIFINCYVSAIRNTNNGTSYWTSNDIIADNHIVSNLATGKGIEDNANLGSTIVGNTIYHTGTAQSTEGPIGSEGQHIWCGIITTGGRRGIISSNTIEGGWYDGIRLNRFQKVGSSLTPVDYLVTGNVINGCTRNGIRAEINSTYTMNNVGITNNTVGVCGAAGIALSNSGTGGDIKYLDLSGNRVYDNGATTATDAQKSGIYINTTITGLNMVGGYIYDSGSATQKYGITIDTVAVTSAHLNAIKMDQNTTQAINLTGGGTIAGEIYNNPGYNLGAAAITVTASPFTYTAGATPEIVYITGGTVTSIVKNSVTLAASITNLTVPLRPNESIVVTYAVAPTMAKDRK